MIVAEVVTMLIYIASMWLLPTYFGKGQLGAIKVICNSFPYYICRHVVYLDRKVCYKVGGDHRHQ